MKFYTNISTVGNRIHVRGYNKGVRYRDSYYYKPTLYLPSKEPTDFQTLHGHYVSPTTFESMGKARQFIDQFQGIENFELYGQENFSACVAYELFGGEDFTFDSSLIKICYMDIEVASERGFPEPEHADEEVQLITLKQGNAIISLGLGDCVPPKGCKYIKCDDEQHMLRKFLKIWRRLDMDIVTGWNVDGFDIPYLYNRISKILSTQEANSLSPLNICRWGNAKYDANSAQNLRMLGIDVIDYFDIYRKYGVTENLESYSLNNVSAYELDEKKIDYSEYGSLHLLYKQNFQKYLEYNIHDVLLVEKLENKLRLLQMVLTISYMARTNFEDVYRQTRLWDSIVYMHLQAQNIIIPVRKENFKASQYAGAYVKEPIPGMYEWVVSYDAESLYPSMIITHNIGPETLVEDLPRLNCSIDDLLAGKVSNPHPHLSMTANGYFFRKDKPSFLATILDRMGDDRKKYKKKRIQAEKLVESIKLEISNRRQNMISN